MIFAIRLTSIASIGRARAGKSGGLLDLGLGDHSYRWGEYDSPDHSDSGGVALAFSAPVVFTVGAGFAVVGAAGLGLACQLNLLFEEEGSATDACAKAISIPVAIGGDFQVDALHGPFP